VAQAPDGSLMLLVDAKDGALLRLTPEIPPTPSR
jgi:glucose/arabinose dehydrogenase